MKAARYFILGAVLGIVMDGCATQGAFTYKRYGLDAVSYDGNLLGPTSAQDLPLKECEPTPATPTAPAVKGKCVVMLRDEFYRMKGDFLTLEKQLISCQQGVKPQ
jgi:hypothetical protein